MMPAVSRHYLWGALVTIFMVSAIVFLAPTLMRTDTFVSVPEQESMSLASQVFVQSDPSASRGIDEIADPANVSRFRHATFRDLTPGYTHDAIWYTLTLVNPQQRPLDLYLDVGPPRLPDVQLYFRGADGGWEHMRGGLQVPVRERPVLSRQSVFPVSLQPGERRPLYIRIAGDNALMLDARLWSPSRYNDAQRSVDLVNGMQFGAILLFSLYALLLFLGTRERMFLYFGVTLLAFGCYDIAIFGYGYQYLWVHSPGWAMRSPGVFLAVTVFGGGMLVAELLQSRRNFAVLDRYLRGLAWLSLATIPFLLCFRYSALILVTNFLALCMVILNLGAALYALTRGYRGAGLFFVAFILLWFTSFVRICQIIGVLPYNVLTDYSQSWSMIVSGMLMAIALADKVRLLRLERELARQSADTARIEARVQAEKEVELRTHELRMARDLAQAASNAKSTFLAHLSHELRTPLHSILGYSGLIRNDSASTVDRHRIEAVQRSGRHLLDLIDGLLDFARIEAGRLSLEPCPVHLRSFLDAVLDESREMARAAGIALQADVAVALPPVVLADRVRLRQVLVNLITNACRHGQGTRVTLEVSARPAEGGLLRLCFGVRDDGVGICEADRERIFAPFEQGGRQPRSGPGMGLGLAISRQLVQLMGGQLLLEAPAEGGSLFHFCLTLEAGEAEGLPPVQGVAAGRRYAGVPRRVLVVDDIADNRDLLADTLAASGFGVVLADSVGAALALLATATVDAVVTDQLMPGGSGWELLRRARGAGHGMPFVMVSAARPSPPADWTEPYAFAAILIKPVESPLLAEVLGQALGLEWQPDDDATPASAFTRVPAAASLAALRRVAEQGRISDIEDWVDEVIAAHPEYGDFALAVREAVRRLDLPAILRMTRPPA